MESVANTPSIWENVFSANFVIIKPVVWGEWSDSMETLVAEEESDFSGAVTCAMHRDGQLYIMGTLDNGQVSMMPIHPDDWTPRYNA